jgi:hypothetical protein
MVPAWTVTAKPGFVNAANSFAKMRKNSSRSATGTLSNTLMDAMTFLRAGRWSLLMAVLLGLILALVGPFGTYADLRLDARLFYWLSISILNGIQVLLALAFVRWLARGRWPIAAMAAACAVLASIPATLEVAALEYILRQPVPRNPLFYFPEVLLLTAAITVPIVILRARLQAQADALAAASQPVPGGPKGETLLKRLKPETQGELLALQMEDHYLRIHTSAGNDLILHRLSDALAEVAGLDGRQVHRSYWVARSAVRGVEREGRRMVLVLKNGLKVPVSRANVAAIREAGWL